MKTKRSNSLFSSAHRPDLWSIETTVKMKPSLIIFQAGAPQRRRRAPRLQKPVFAFFQM